MSLDFILENLRPLLVGAASTVVLTIATMALAVLIAVPMSIARNSQSRFLRWSVATYSWIFRAIPNLAVLFFMYYGLPSVGIYLNAWTAAVIGMSLTAVAYTLEIVYAGLRSVPVGQFECARALGMPLWLMMRRIILPQVMRVVLPPLFSEFTMILKGTSLAALVAVSELTGRAMSIISITYRPIEILVAAAAMYLVMNSALLGLQFWLERKYGIKSARTIYVTSA